jgi:hypothetical protein
MIFYRWLTNASAMALIGILIIGAFGLSGCTVGDTYSGVVTNVDCDGASSGGGLQNCGTGSPTDEHGTEELMFE